MTIKEGFEQHSIHLAISPFSRNALSPFSRNALCPLADLSEFHQIYLGDSCTMPLYCVKMAVLKSIQIGSYKICKFNSDG